MVLFAIEGPIEIPLGAPDQHGKRRISEDLGRGQKSKFWESHPKLGSACGCYVFCLKAGPGMTPVYVGKTKRSFREECFTSRNVLILMRYRQKRKGTPCVFFLKYPRKQGKPSDTLIQEIEDFLILTARAKKSELGQQN